jgi:sortase (surface protein transpeptidase)
VSAARLAAATVVAALLSTGCAATTAAQPTPPTGAPPATAAPAEAPAAVADPRSVRVPAIGVDAALVGLGLLADGAMEVPEFGLAGWYTPGPRPGEPGPAVVAAHVDSRSGPDVFARLRELAPGDRVEVADAAGAVHAFVVERVEQHPKDELPVDAIWSPSAEPLLRLITCGGAFDPISGHYRDNVIVFARAA